MRLDYASYVFVITVGILMAILVFANLTFRFGVNSDGFWFLAGAGLAIDGIISYKKQKRFDLKYRIVERLE